MGVLDESEVCI